MTLDYKDSEFQYWAGEEELVGKWPRPVQLIWSQTRVLLQVNFFENVKKAKKQHFEPFPPFFFCGDSDKRLDWNVGGRSVGRPVSSPWPFEFFLLETKSHSSQG